ncbi:hypothetical protein SBOR_6705 [Sclerotinia borealis F-4128]|uniref:Uncharacterized protein n=1 Tax=Sclerotinia borealis (strain F-4128) TaxID=1432307 RepID=W9C867_SCLBF|nr:hypothetical protein SBOR_6705 [Sclerotinia borealis F-4128]
MERVTATDVVKSLESILAYAGQLSRVFHRHRLVLEIESVVPYQIEEHIGLVNSTIGTLNEVLGVLLRNDAGTNQNRLFSEEGLRHVSFLEGECATILAKIAPTVAKAGLKRERKKKRKNAKKSKAEIIAPVVPMQLKLDEEKFLNDLENAIWYRANDDICAYMGRLKEVQLHLLLVYQVVTVGSLSRDLSSGKIDIQKIVSYHERINRTADLIRISPSSRRRGFHSRSSSVYTLSESDGDSDDSSIISRRRRPPPPPIHVLRNGPPPPPAFRGGLPPTSCMGTAPPPPLQANSARPLGPPLSTFAPRVVNLTTPNVNPPSYDSHTGLDTPPLKQTSPLPNPLSSPHIFPDEKCQDNMTNREIKVEKQQIAKKPHESSAQEGRLFNSSHTRLSFKIKSLFRSKDSLAAEMKKVLENTSSVLEAFLIQNVDIRPIPHSAFHSLEATHMRTILSQLNNNSWFETYSKLTRTEHDVLGTAIHPFGTTDLRREIVALKVLPENQNNAWMCCLAGKLRTASLPQQSNGRVILAILREPLVDGERKAWVANGTMPPPDCGRALYPPPRTFIGARGSLPPPPPPPPPPPMFPNIKPLPITALNALNRPRFIGPDGPRPPAFNSCPPGTQGRYLPPVFPPRNPPPPPPIPGQTFHMSDRTIYTDAESFVALTTYNEYTLRLAEPVEPNQPRTWSRIVITHEPNAQTDILAHINSFVQRGGSIIDAKLRLTDLQSAHMTQVMEEILLKERDYRFEWCWVELSLYDSTGEINHGSRGNGAQSATIMHLIAKRTLKREYKPADVYNVLMTRGPPLPPLPPNFYNTLPPRPGPPQPMPSGPPPPPPPPPLSRAPPPAFTEYGRPRSGPRGHGRNRRVSMSDLDSSGYSGSDSDSSYDSRRGRVRRRRRNNGRVRQRYYDSESSDDSEEEDGMKIPVVWKRGDDVVQKLLDLWTPGAKILGGKERE